MANISYFIITLPNQTSWSILSRQVYRNIAVRTDINTYDRYF